MKTTRDSRETAADDYAVVFEHAAPGSPARQSFPTFGEALAAAEQRGDREPVGEVQKRGYPLTLKNLRNEWRWNGGADGGADLDLSPEEMAALLAGQADFSRERGEPVTAQVARQLTALARKAQGHAMEEKA